MQQRRASISPVSPMMGAGERLGIIIAVPLNRPAGVFAGVYSLDAVKGWLNGVPESIKKWVSIVDQAGIIVLAPDWSGSGALRNVGEEEDVKRALAGESGTELVRRGGKEGLVSRRSLPSVGWGLLIQIPKEEIDKAFWRAEKPLALLSLVFVALALGIGGTGAVLFRRLRESREHMRQIVATASDAFVAMDESGIITDWNPQAERVFGRPEAEALGQSLHTTIIPERFREAHLRGLKHFLVTGEGPVLNKRLELAALHRDGREFPVELSISLVRKRGKSSFNAFVRDISERNRAQEEIANLNAELQVRVLQLETRNKDLEAFSYSVSHDVRAPLRHISGFSRLLAVECEHQITSQGQAYLKQIQDSSARLQRLVDDLLRFSRLGEQGLLRQMTSLDEVVAEVISSIERDLNGRNVRFEVSGLRSVECDRGLVTQVFWNLLSNAVKFTATRERAVIAVGECRHGREEVLFVRDNGVGFEMKYADKLFSVFQRLHGDEFDGSGIGLAMVQRIISRHGGRIWAEAEPARGATFYFNLGPAAANAPACTRVATG
ncbi:MAG TPA: PAS domain S-box protein [Candidatus Angelobacter sp.]